MAKKTAKRVKHVPQRTCVGCRQTLAKRSLIRIVRTPEGLRVDPTGKIPGRGSYLHDQRSCWESGLKGALAHALKVDLTDQDRETLRNYMLTLPKDELLPKEEKVKEEAPLPQDMQTPEETALPPKKQGKGSDREEIAGSASPQNLGKHTMTR